MTTETFDRGAEVSLDDIARQAERAKAVVAQVREKMLPPKASKRVPRYSTGQLMSYTGLDRSQISYRIKKGELPGGELNAGRTRREFTLPDVRQWMREVHAAQLRPDGAEAVTLAVGNFKGGVSKTTTVLTLAQGLSLRGHRVLVIDCDPQGSLTTLFGLLPDSEVMAEGTLMPLFDGDEQDVTYAIRPTYWDGIDLIAGTSALFAAEFSLPAKQSRDTQFAFWDVLNAGLDAVKPEYDVILIDTPPALSYATINALMAADGIVMPLPPNALDFASSAQFWDMFSDLANQLIRKRGGTKEFAFIDILLARVDAADQSSAFVRQWISAAYVDKVLPVEIPKTVAASTSSAEFGTIYDAAPAQTRTRTFKRAFEAYERFCEIVEGQIQAFWRRQLED